MALFSLFKKNDLPLHVERMKTLSCMSPRGKLGINGFSQTESYK